MVLSRSSITTEAGPLSSRLYLTVIVLLSSIYIITSMRRVSSISNLLLIFICTSKFLYIMAFLGTNNNEIPANHIKIPMHLDDIKAKPAQDTEENNVDHCQRAQWLHAVVLGANDGLVSVTSPMMSVGALTDDITTMLLAGFAGLVVGACTMAIGVFGSVYTQLNIEVSQMEREREVNYNKEKEMEEDGKLLNPFQTAIASAIAFSVGAVVPLLAAAFIRDYKIRLVIVAALASLALLVFGVVGFGKSKTLVRRTCGQSADWRLDDYGYYFWL